MSLNKKGVGDGGGVTYCFVLSRVHYIVARNERKVLYIV